MARVTIRTIERSRHGVRASGEVYFGNGLKSEMPEIILNDEERREFESLTQRIAARTGSRIKDSLKSTGAEDEEAEAEDVGIVRG